MNNNKIFLLGILGILAVLLFFSVSVGTPVENRPGAASVVEITSEGEFEKVITESPGKLLVFDLYADWCGPCRMLSPILEEIARENSKNAVFYKVNVDRHPRIAAEFKVQGIPHVAFVKDRNVVYSMVGLRSKSAYLRTISLFSQEAGKNEETKADGKLVAGIRVIELQSDINPHEIYVYRGETVKIVFDRQNFPFSVHIPGFRISKESVRGEPLEVMFKASKVGIYPVFCNGDCPAGDGSMVGRIVVTRYQAGGTAQFKGLTAEEASKLIKSQNPVIVDVRTPKEFYAGHIPGALLLPLQQLSSRISEIDAYREKPVILYCRSGNRSVVAAEVLIEKGFKKIWHIRKGILEWQKKGLPIKS